MRGRSFSNLLYWVLYSLLFCLVRADNPYKFLTWTVTYGTIYPLGFPQQGILINDQFPGPRILCMTNDNIILNVVNKLDQPFLITWNGIKQRKNSWQDGVLGTNCPIPPGGNYTYRFQPKDQIGTYSYFPSTGMHKAAGGFGGIIVVKRPFIPVPYPPPAGDNTVLIGDWYKYSHKTLQHFLDAGNTLPFPDGVLINGQQHSSTFNVDQEFTGSTDRPGFFLGDQSFTYEVGYKNVFCNRAIQLENVNFSHKSLSSLVRVPHILKNLDVGAAPTRCRASAAAPQLSSGKTYLFRISNVGMQTSLNFRIQGHKLKLVEIEGTHPIQNVYDSLDVHVGQSVAVLVTADQPPNDYYIVASSRFTRRVLTATAVLHYTNSRTRVSGPIPAGPTYQLAWSLNQARSFRWNLTASAARPNPQGSYHYGQIVPSRTIVLANSAPRINGKQRYAVNGISYVNPDTPLKLADHFKIPGVFSLNSIQDFPPENAAYLGTAVTSAAYHAFVEIVLQNNEDTLQSWHLDGYDFWVVGMGLGQWSRASRRTYNLVDAPTRYTVQVYPRAWTAIYVSFDNEGMWNLRSAAWPRQYLGHQLYVRVWTPERSLQDEYNIPTNALLCGRARGHRW